MQLLFFKQGLDDALENLRTIFNTELMELMEKYARFSRQDLLGICSTMTEMYEEYLEKLIAACGPYYDYSIETSSDFRSPRIVRAEDVWAPIAQLEITPANVREVLYARKIVDRLKREDFQRRF